MVGFEICMEKRGTEWKARARSIRAPPHHHMTAAARVSSGRPHAARGTLPEKGSETSRPNQQQVHDRVEGTT